VISKQLSVISEHGNCLLVSS